MESLVKVFGRVKGAKSTDPTVQAYLHTLLEANPKTVEEERMLRLTKEDKQSLKRWWFVKEIAQEAAREAEMRGEAERRRLEAEIQELKARLRDNGGGSGSR